MDYQKYLKYKTKYLQLKAKSLQLGGGAKSLQLGGGAKCTHLRTDINFTLLRKNPINNNDWATDIEGNNISIFNDEKVDVLETIKDGDIEFGRIEKNGVNGWVNMKHLWHIWLDDKKVPTGKKVPCKFKSPSSGSASSGSAASGSAVSGSAASIVLVPGLTPSAPPVVSMRPYIPGAVAMSSSAMSSSAMPSFKTAEQMLSSSTGLTTYGCTHDLCRAHAGITAAHAILVVKDDTGTSGVLLGKERTGRYSGEYNMFGGGRDTGECILSCLYREISEEARFLCADGKINWDNFIKIFMNRTGDFHGYRIHHGTSAVFVGVIRRGNLFFNAQGALPVGTPQVYDGNSSNLVRDIKATFTTLISRGVESQYCEMDDVVLFDPIIPMPKISSYASSNIRHLLGQIQNT